MSSKGFKQDLFSQFARVGKALSNSNRLELLEFLAQREHSVEDLASVAGLSVANTSQHLQQLRQAGLVESRKQGLKVYYRLSGEDVVYLLDALRNVAERHLAEVEKLVNTYLTVKDELEPVPREELTGSPFGNSAGLFGDDDAAEAAAEAAEAAAEDVSNPDNWSDEDRARVEQLEAEYDAAFDKYFEAMEAAEANARTQTQEDSK